MICNFSATQNNGRIVSSADAVTGENVSYSYDSLNRLIAAATTNNSGPMWGESYGYDEFGNLTAKVGTGGAPTVTPQVNSQTNQASMTGDNGFDLNGNWLGTGSTQVNVWNVENQMISNGSVDSMSNPLTYTYDPWGKRVLKDEGAAICGPYGTVYFYSVSGQLLGTYTGVDSLNLPAGCYSIVAITNLYFGNRLLQPVDRLGSVRNGYAYYPWGEERAPGTTDSGGFMFGTYWRDGYLGSSNNPSDQAYAQARYYNNKLGRFWSSDPRRHANMANPQSWNQYAYAGGDPTNRRDPRGTDPEDEEQDWGELSCGPLQSIWDETCVMAIFDPTQKGLPYAGSGSGSPYWAAMTAVGATTYVFRQEMNTELQKLPQSCYNAFAKIGVTQQDLQNNVNNVLIYDSAGPAGALTLQQVAGAYASLGVAGNQTVQSYAQQESANGFTTAVDLTVTVGGQTQYLPDIILTPLFWAQQPLDVDPMLVLVHELLHHTSQMGDQDLVKALNIPQASGQTASWDLSSWLANSCGGQ